MHRWLLAFLAVWASALATPASAQPAGHVQLSVAVSHSAVRAGETVLVAVVLDHAEGWHSHTNAPPIPESWGDFPAIATAVAVRDAVGLTATGVQWPPTHTVHIDLAYTGTPEPYEVFDGKAVVYIPLSVADDAAGRVSARVLVQHQACDDSTCDMPVFLGDESATFKIELPIAPESVRDPQHEALFAGFDPALVEPLASEEPAPAEPADAPTLTADSRTFFGMSVPKGSGWAALAVLGLLSALGGLILNLTPCVLPVIPIKIMTISQHAATPGKSLALGVWMALGVIAFWLALGLPVAFLTSVTDPSRLFGIWWVTLGIGLLIAAMGVGIMGLFEIQLPRAVYAINPKADSPQGSFLFGVMTAVLGLPCFGFVAGALLAGSAALSKTQILVIFGGLGVGMALPYLILSANPKLVSRVPRTGPASSLVKQVMGLLLLAAAAYFIGSGLIALVNDRPYLGKQLHWWTIAIFASLAGAWLALRLIQITKTAAPKIAGAIVGLILGGTAVLFALDSTNRAKEQYLAIEAAMARSDSPIITGVWVPYSESLRQRALDEGYVVVRDFTAEWCLNCKALKAAVLSREPVKTLLAADDVVLMTVDLTGNNGPGQEALDAMGEVGIPLLVVEGPGGSWKSNAYTAQQVTDALEMARGESARAAR